MAASPEEEVARTARDEESIRRYLVNHEILTVPADSALTVRPMPDYLAALDGFGRTDDFTGLTRHLHPDICALDVSPSNHLPYFHARTRGIHRTGLHEGVPGHFSFSYRCPGEIPI